MCSQKQRVTNSIEIQHRSKSAVANCGDNDHDGGNDDDINDYIESDIPMDSPFELPSVHQDALQRFEPGSDDGSVTLSCEDDDRDLEHFEEVAER